MLLFLFFLSQLPYTYGKGPCGLPSPRIFMILGGMKAAFVPYPSPGPWRARRLDNADVDSCVWLASTRTYIARAVPFIVWKYSGLGGYVEFIKRQQQQQLHQTKEISYVLEISGFSFDFRPQITVLRHALRIWFLSFSWDITHLKTSWTRLLGLFVKKSKILKYAHSCKLVCEFVFWVGVQLPASGPNIRWSKIEYSK